MATETEHTTLSLDELDELLDETEDLEEMVIDFGPDTLVSLEILDDKDGIERLYIGIGETDEETNARDRYRLVRKSAEQIYGLLKLPTKLMSQVPPELTLPIVNWYLGEQKGSVKLLIKEGIVVSICSPSTEIYSTRDLVNTIITTYRSKYNLSDVLVDNVTHDLELTEITLLFPETAELVDDTSGTVLMTGIHMRTSVLGKKPLLLQGVVARDYHLNSMLSDNNLVQWDRRRTKSVDMDDVETDRAYDVYDWVADSVVLLHQDSENDKKNVVRLGRIDVGDHSTAVQTDIFGTFNIPTKAQGVIRLAFSEEPEPNLLGMWNAITTAANDPEIVDNPGLVRKLREAGGAVAFKPHTCPSCYRLTGGSHNH